MAALLNLSNENHKQAFLMRGLGCLVASLVLVIGLFRFWPVPEPTEQDDGRLVEVQQDETIEIELIEPTRQNYAIPPAPPPPPQEVLLPPVEVPDTEIIEETVDELVVDLPVRDPVPNAPPAPPSPQGAPGQPATGPPEPTLVQSPDRSPVTIRFSQPTYPDAARREGIRARVRVEVLVDERGRVMETRIAERILIGNNEREERVSSLPYGLDSAALEAARRSQFRPARHNGQAVRSYTTITCNFGV